MTALSVRLLTDADLDSALMLSSTAGWNQRRDDWYMLLTLAPRGGFAALDDGRIVGTSIGIDYGGFGWIAMMLVDPAYRGRGLGRDLLEAAIDAVPRDRPIRLDATPMGRPLYQRYGFEDEAMLTRLVVDARTRQNLHRAIEKASAVRPLAAADLRLVAREDRQIFGGNRRSVLDWALGRSPEYAWIAGIPGDLPQYCFGRRGRLFDQIGPVVASDDNVAGTLISAALAAAPNAVAVDVFDVHTALTAWLTGCGFRAERPLFRMRRPPVQASGGGEQPRSSAAEFAIFGPEFG